MSPLTKLFVVLLVVLSLLLAASTVVFVNQVNDFKASADLARIQLTSAKNEANDANLAKSAAQEAAATAQQQANAQIESTKRDLNQAQQDIASRNADLARAKAQLDIQAVSVTTLSGTLKASEETRSRLQEQLNDLRATNDKLVAQNAQFNQTVTDLTSRLDVTERERRLLAEQLTEAKAQIDRQSSMLKDAGISPAQLASSAGTGIGAPPINGVIRDVRPIQGVPYASITVGSAESVTPGMQFNVVGQNGQWLGILKIDHVEQNESTGRLEGPHVNEIRPGAQVKTQL